MSSGASGDSNRAYMPYNVRAAIHRCLMNNCLYTDFGLRTRYSCGPPAWLGHIGLACAISWQRSDCKTGGQIMKPIARAVPFLVSVFATALCAIPAMAQTDTKPPATYPALPSEIPAKFTPKNESFDYFKRSVMIPMRDGVKLHTVILIPKGAKGAPILLTRTPYSADKLTSHAESAHLGPVLNGYDNALDVILEGGYIRVVQDVRGKYGSEGYYVVNRPLRGPLNK